MAGNSFGAGGGGGGDGCMCVFITPGEKTQQKAGSESGSQLSALQRCETHFCHLH